MIKVLYLRYLQYLLLRSGIWIKPAKLGTVTRGTVEAPQELVKELAPKKVPAAEAGSTFHKALPFVSPLSAQQVES